MRASSGGSRTRRNTEVRNRANAKHGVEEGTNNDTFCGQSVNVPKAARAASLLEVASVPSRCVASTEVILLCWLLVILNCALTICGKENLFCKACVFRFATRPFL